MQYAFLLQLGANSLNMYFGNVVVTRKSFLWLDLKFLLNNSIPQIFFTCHCKEPVAKQTLIAVVLDLLRN